MEKTNVVKIPTIYDDLTIIGTEKAINEMRITLQSASLYYFNTRLYEHEKMTNAQIDAITKVLDDDNFGDKD